MPAPPGRRPTSSSPPAKAPPGTTAGLATRAAPRATGTGPGAKPVPGGRRLPEATVKRLPLYLRGLLDARNNGQITISSDELAGRVGANAAQVRKDLSFLGSYGTRGIGYDIELLYQHINRQLGLNREYNVALVGAGNLGQALGHYRGFAERGFHVVAAFDSDPDKVGKALGDAVVHPLSELARVVSEKSITMALIATPASVAQDIADRLVEAGVTSVLNFAPTVLNVSPSVCVRKVDLAVELQILGYYDHSRRQESASNLDRDAPAAPRGDQVAMTGTPA